MNKVHNDKTGPMRQKGFGQLKGDDFEFIGKTYDKAADRYMYGEKAVGWNPRVTTDERGTP